MSNDNKLSSKIMVDCSQWYHYREQIQNQCGNKDKENGTIVDKSIDKKIIVNKYANKSNECFFLEISHISDILL